MTMEDDVRASSNKFVILFALLAVYLLAFGPVEVYVFDNHALASSVCEIIYWPLITACERSPALEAIVIQYIDLWR